MRRAVLAVTLAAVASLGGAVAGAQAPRLAAKLVACESGARAGDRFAVFNGAMPREGAAAMAVRFDLEQRLPGGRFARVRLARWGRWERTAKEGAPGFIVTKRVERLAAPAQFRAVVGFRWYDAAGRVIRSARRTSPICRQPDWRPDLRVESVTFTAGRRAEALIVNRGRAPSGPFAVSMGAGNWIVSRDVESLPAGQRRTVTLWRCAAPEQAVVTVDADGRVAERREDDNALRVACPAR